MRALRRDGASVVAADLEPPDPGLWAADGPDIVPLACDMSEFDAVDAMLRTAIDQLGREQVLLGDKLGFHSFWTVEHHFCEEFSHCSNPEVSYGAVAATTEKLRIGYGVRMMPQPYNHPVRSGASWSAGPTTSPSSTASTGTSRRVR